MISHHNDKLIVLARQILAAGGADNPPVMPIHLVSDTDTITFNMFEFEAAIRSNSSQSLKYGQGGDVTYDFAEIEEWVIEKVVGNIPVFSDAMSVFAWVGEGVQYKDVIGGIHQEEIPEDIAGTVAYKELNSLNLLQTALDKLLEAIGFMDILSAEDANQNFASYCTEVIHFSESELSIFGSPSSAFRTAVQLKHLTSLRKILEEAINPSSRAPATISPLYTVELSSEQQASLTAFVETTGQENLETLLTAYCTMLNGQFKVLKHLAFENYTHCSKKLALILN